MDVNKLRYRKTTKAIIISMLSLMFCLLIYTVLIIQFRFALIVLIPMMPILFYQLIDTLLYYIELTDKGIIERCCFRKKVVLYSEILDVYEQKIKIGNSVIVVEGKNENLIEIYSKQLRHSSDLLDCLIDNTRNNVVSDRRRGYQNINGQRYSDFQKKSKKWTIGFMIVIVLVAVICNNYFI